MECLFEFGNPGVDSVKFDYTVGARKLETIKNIVLYYNHGYNVDFNELVLSFVDNWTISIFRLSYFALIEFHSWFPGNHKTTQASTK